MGMQHKPVIYVLDNHRYCGKTAPRLWTEVNESARGVNVHVL